MIYRMNAKRKRFAAIRMHKFYYFLMIPGFLYYIIFHYIPMFGVMIAFKDISPFSGVHGIFHDPWVGFRHFERFFQSHYFWDILGNTVILGFYKLLFTFVTSIGLALLINEVRNTFFKRLVQSLSYMPYFVSMVVLASLVMMFLNTEQGVINQLIHSFGFEKHNFLGDPDLFRGILVSADVWHSVGWGTILYLAAMAGIDPAQYEAAKMDGANIWQQMIYITIPGITFVIVLLLILNIGRFLDAGFELVLLLYSPSVYEVADIIDTYVFREGLVNLNYSFTAAVNLFKNVVGMILILLSNYLANRLNQTGIW